MSKLKLVIDTDGVADDIRAISIALQYPNVEVLAVTVVCGCVNVDQAVANIARTLRANNCTGIPIYKGASNPIIGNIDIEKREKLFFGNDGLSDLPLEHPKVLANDWNAYENEHAALALIRIFENNPDTTLACIGPLTNIALALKLDPRFRKWAKKIVIMGGNIHAMGNVSSHSTAEFNFSYDPEAAHIVLKEMECEKILIPWETFVLESSKNEIDFHAHLEIDHELARFFKSATSIGRKRLESLGRQFSYCDEICIAVAICPERIIVAEKLIRGTVELQGKFTRGQVALAWVFEKLSHEMEGPMTELKFVINYHAANLDKLMYETIHRCTENSL